MVDIGWIRTKTISICIAFLGGDTDTIKTVNGDMGSRIVLIQWKNSQVHLVPLGDRLANVRKQIFNYIHMVVFTVNKVCY